MSALIIKLGAAGDVVRTTVLLHIFDDVTWITNACNIPLLPNYVRAYSWEDRFKALYESYDIVFNLEDSIDTALFLEKIRYRQLFGCCMDDRGLSYTEDSSPWFDMGLISKHGRTCADALKKRNRLSYQEILFGCLGCNFDGEPYVIAAGTGSKLSGNVAISNLAGNSWKLKSWPFYDELADELRSKGDELVDKLRCEGLIVNILPYRDSVLEHISDICNHQCLVSADSLPMHIALGSYVKCVSLFTCTSPWEIYGYGVQVKIVSPLLEQFFYSRDYDDLAAKSISMKEVRRAVYHQLRGGLHETRGRVADIYWHDQAGYAYS